MLHSQIPGLLCIITRFKDHTTTITAHHSITLMDRLPSNALPSLRSASAACHGSVHLYSSHTMLYEFSWGAINKHLATLDKALMTAKQLYPSLVSDTVSLLMLLTKGQQKSS